MTQEDEFQKINKKLDVMHNRLFVDNGSPCIQTRLDRNERMWKVTMWIVSVVCAASITQTVGSVYDHIALVKSNSEVKVAQ